MWFFYCFTVYCLKIWHWIKLNLALLGCGHWLREIHLQSGPRINPCLQKHPRLQIVGHWRVCGFPHCGSQLVPHSSNRSFFSHGRQCLHSPVISWPFKSHWTLQPPQKFRLHVASGTWGQISFAQRSSVHLKIVTPGGQPINTRL